jgi:hypothetical protein
MPNDGFGGWGLAGFSLQQPLIGRPPQGRSSMLHRHATITAHLAAVRGALTAVIGLSALMSCAPYIPRVPEAMRAGAVARQDTPDFSVAPPPGRWIVERIPAGRPDKQTPAPWDSLLVDMAVECRAGLRFCCVPRVGFITGSDPPRGPDNPPVKDCFFLQAYRLPDGPPALGAAGEFAGRLASVVPAIVKPRTMEPDFWRGLKWTDAHARLGQIVIGPRPFHEVCLVDDRNETRVLGETPRLLLCVQGSTLIFVCILDGKLKQDGDAWKVIESLKIEAPAVGTQ